MGNETAWVCIAAVATVAIVGLTLAFMFKNQPAQTLQYQPQLTQYQPKEVLIKLTEAGRLSEVTPLM